MAQAVSRACGLVKVSCRSAIPQPIRSTSSRCTPASTRCCASAGEGDGESASSDGGEPKKLKTTWGKRLARQSNAALSSVSRAPSQLVNALTPKEAGDVMDLTLMAFSTVVLVWCTMHLYTLYAYLYHAAGLKTIAEMLNP